MMVRLLASPERSGPQLLGRLLPMLGERQMVLYAEGNRASWRSRASVVHFTWSRLRYFLPCPFSPWQGGEGGRQAGWGLIGR